MTIQLNLGEIDSMIMQSCYRNKATLATQKSHFFSDNLGKFEKKESEIILHHVRPRVPRRKCRSKLTRGFLWLKKMLD